MKHFNNSLQRNVNVSNIPEFEPDYSPKNTESVFVILLILLGIAGAVYTFNLGFKSSLSKATSQITKNIASPVIVAQIPETLPSEYQPNKQPDAAQLLIFGEKEANQSMKFTIESFDKKANYDLIMGDGVTLHPKHKTIEYTYQKPGNYRIQLKVNYDGKSEKLFSKKIQILESIAVAPNAHQEY